MSPSGLFILSHFLPVSAIQVMTPDAKHNEQFWLTYNEPLNFIYFSVEACSNALISLAEVPFNLAAGSFEIELGVNSNAESVIRVNNTEISRVPSPGILHCNESRIFWVDWRFGHLNIGTGNDVMENGILGYDDLEFEVSALSFATHEGQQGTWTLIHATGIRLSHLNDDMKQI